MAELLSRRRRLHHAEQPTRPALDVGELGPGRLVRVGSLRLPWRPRHWQLFASGWMLGAMHYSGLWSEAAGSPREGRIAFRRVSRANKRNKTKTSSHLELMDPFIYLFICLETL